MLPGLIRFPALMMSLLRLSINRGALRTLGMSRLTLRAAPVLQNYKSRTRLQTFATSATGAASNQKLDRDLANMDIDAAERHMKDWFGDHASWSHEQLLRLVYGTTFRQEHHKPSLTASRGRHDTSGSS